MRRVLPVCPDSVVTEDLTFFLQHSGSQVSSVVESMQAMVEMGRRTPDVIVMRENTRRVNGDELCVRIRELSDVPIVVLGQGQEELAGVEMLEMLEMGADACLTWPFHPREDLAGILPLLCWRRHSQDCQNALRVLPGAAK